MLIRPVSDQEIDTALKAIEDSKAPGIDGFHSDFFKQVWGTVKEDISVLSIWSTLTAMELHFCHFSAKSSKPILCERFKAHCMLYCSLQNHF